MTETCTKIAGVLAEMALRVLATGPTITLTLGEVMALHAAAMALEIPTTNKNKPKLDPTLLLDNAACASQCRELLDDHPTRQAVLMNVYRPLWDEIERLQRERNVLEIDVQRAARIADHLRAENHCQCGHPMVCHSEFSCRHYGCDCKGATEKPDTRPATRLFGWFCTVHANRKVDGCAACLSLSERYEHDV